MEDVLINLCQNFTTAHDISECNTHIVNVTGDISETNSTDMGKQLAVAEMVHNVKYYIEGVILTPVATIGLFGKFIINIIPWQ